jgi:hypothetical protein
MTPGRSGCKGWERGWHTVNALQCPRMSKLDLRRRVTGTLLVTVLTCGGIACGGSTIAGSDAPDGGSSPDGTSGKDSGSKADSGHAHDAKTSDAHPADVGTPSETGGDDAADDTTGDDSSTPDATGVDAPIGPGCPGSPPSGLCTMPQQTCEYTTGVCICSHGSLPTTQLSWHCTTLSSGCPDPQPTLHATCTQPGLTCDYGACMGGQAFECTAEGAGDEWENAGIACPG